MPQKIQIGIIGGNSTDEASQKLAYETGSLIANNGAILICGGLGGIMEAAAQGAADQGGVVVGLLPSTDNKSANPWINVVIPTGLGNARNALVVNASDALIAFPGSYGTLSEIALALAIGKCVVYMPGTWNLKKIAAVDSALFKEAHDAREAVGLALNAIMADSARGV